MSDQKEKSVAGKIISGKKWSLFFTNIANIYMRKVPISRKKKFIPVGGGQDETSE